MHYMKAAEKARMRVDEVVFDSRTSRLFVNGLLDVLKCAISRHTRVSVFVLYLH